MTFPVPPSFSWDGKEDLRREVELAGLRFRDCCELVPDKSSRLLLEMLGKSWIFPRAEEQVSTIVDACKAYDHLQAITKKCCVDHGLDIALVRRATIPHGKKYDTERERREDDLNRSIARFNEQEERRKMNEEEHAAKKQRTEK